MKVSINVLTKNRRRLLEKALLSVRNQNFKDYEIVVVNDGSTDDTQNILENLKIENLNIIKHESSVGITLSRREALLDSKGEYVAILDDDDEWIDEDKLAKQVKYLDKHQDCVVVGGGITISNIKYQISKFRPETDERIRNWMLLKNPFFTSTVMFRREATLKVGGFVKDDIDLGEDYDLWLRLGKIGKMYNFPEAFTLYAKPRYNKEKFKQFLRKQLRLIDRHAKDYPHHLLAKLILKARLIL
jgi:glycosyltransferase involved in cell wall biosynthesis